MAGISKGRMDESAMGGMMSKMKGKTPMMPMKKDQTAKTPFQNAAERKGKGPSFVKRGK